MRGKGLVDCAAVIIKGITPAYAGKRIFNKTDLAAVKDHPRLCGEKFYKSGNICGAWGSPPPMRGKVLHFGYKIGKFRITPAYAGKS